MEEKVLSYVQQEIEKNNYSSEVLGFDRLFIQTSLKNSFIKRLYRKGLRIILSPLFSEFEKNAMEILCLKERFNFLERRFSETEI